MCSALYRCDYLSNHVLVGTATDYQPQAPRKKGVPEPENTPELWRYSETLPIASLLESWEQKFLSLEWTVDPFNAEDGIMLRYDRATEVSPNPTPPRRVLIANSGKGSPRDLSRARMARAFSVYGVLQCDVGVE